MMTMGKLVIGLNDWPGQCHQHQHAQKTDQEHGEIRLGGGIQAPALAKFKNKIVFYLIDWPGHCHQHQHAQKTDQEEIVIIMRDKIQRLSVALLCICLNQCPQSDDQK